MIGRSDETPEAAPKSPQDPLATAGGTEGSKKFAREFSRGLQGGLEANSGAVCLVCHQPIVRGRRGRPGKVHPRCRVEFDRATRQIGKKVIQFVNGRGG